MRLLLVVMLIVIAVLCSCSPNSIKESDLRDISQIHEVTSIYELFDFERFDSLDDQSVECIRAGEGKTLAIAQAKIWRNDAKLIGVGCPKLRFNEDTRAVPIVWVYLFKENDPKEWFAVSIVKSNQPMIMDLGYKRMVHGDLSMRNPIGDLWQHDIDSTIAFPYKQELAACMVENKLKCYWLGYKVDYYSYNYPNQPMSTKIVWLASDGSTGLLLEDKKTLDLIVKYFQTLHDINDDFKPEYLLEKIRLAESGKNVFTVVKPGSIINIDIFAPN